jgi:hypothetical protein
VACFVCLVGGVVVVVKVARVSLMDPSDAKIIVVTLYHLAGLGLGD